MRLGGKRAIVTGANRSIGRAIAVLFAEEGADVAISYRSDAAGAQETLALVERAGRRGVALGADFSDRAEISHFFDQATAFLGGIDILVNCAAGYDTTAFLDLSIETFDHLLQVGVVAPFILTQFAAKQMIRQKSLGAVVNISSISGVAPYPNRTAHSAAKAALNMLTQAAALELAPHGIRVNAIAPGATPYDQSDLSCEAIPMGRMGVPEDQARAALYLASDDASWVTGQIIVVDGGQSLSFG